MNLPLCALLLVAPAAETAPAPGAPAPPPAEEARALDIGLRKLTDQLAVGLKKVPDASGARFAVLPLTEVGSGARKAQLGVVIAESIAGGLREDHRFSVVERTRLGDVLGEQALQQSGLVDDSKAAKMGEMLEANALVLGQVADAGKFYLVTVRVVDSSNSTVLSAASIKLPASDLVALSRDSVVLRSRSDAVFRSALVPGWGQSYNRQPVKSVLFLVGMGVLAGAGVFALLTAGSAALYYVTCNADCQDGRGRALGPVRLSLLTFTPLRIVVAQALLGAAAMVGLSIITWSANVLDAYLSGVSG